PDPAWPGAVRTAAVDSGRHLARAAAFADHLNVHRALARSVELAEVHRLPASEDESAAMNRDAHRWTDQAGKRVRARIALGVAKTGLVAEQVRVGLQEVSDNVGVRVLVDGDG